MASAVQATYALSDLPGRTLSDAYEVEAMIGKGGMGAVFRGRQIRLRRAIAIKVPHPDVSQDPDFLLRFEREALTMAKLVHPNIVQVYDVVVSRDPATPSYMVMEYAEGQDLEVFLRMQDQSLTVGGFGELLMQVAAGLDAAHARAIVHRDIKPSNVVVTLPDRVPKIMDFGVAGVAYDFDGETATGGTPAFMSPEQVLGQLTTTSSDIYSFAAMIYRLLTRQHPFDASSITALMAAHAHQAPVPATVRNPRLPESINVSLRTGLEKDPAKRPISATQLARAVVHALRPLDHRSFASLFPENVSTDSTFSRLSLSSTMVPRTTRAVRSLAPYVLTAAVLVASAVALRLFLARG
jgi:serine/threonine-protein kinase